MGIDFAPENDEGAKNSAAAKRRHSPLNPT